MKTRGSTDGVAQPSVQSLEDVDDGARAAGAGLEDGRGIDRQPVEAERLHLLGCKIALDDFGTGYGGFSYLKQLPVDFLKIDIEFVRDLVANPDNLHVVKAIVSLARAFGLKTIAEGVEDEQALTLLRAEGVDFAQGFHLGRPCPTSDSYAPLPASRQVWLGSADEAV